MLIVDNIALTVNTYWPFSNIVLAGQVGKITRVQENSKIVCYLSTLRIILTVNLLLFPSGYTLGQLNNLWQERDSLGMFINKRQATTVQVVLEKEKAARGTDVWCGFLLKMEPQWHTYWRNPGQSGLATAIKWNLPAGITAGEVLWPVPERYLEGELVAYVYHTEVMLLVPLHISEGVKSGVYRIAAGLEWLECKESCVPGRTNLVFELTVSDHDLYSPSAAQIAHWLEQIPRPAGDIQLQCWYEAEEKSDSAELVIELPGGLDWLPSDFWPYEGQQYDVDVSLVRVVKAPSGYQLRKKLTKFGETFPSEVRGLLVLLSEEIGKPEKAFEVVLRPILRSSSSVQHHSNQQIRITQPPKGVNRFVIMFCFAFLGGMILNIMPCVFPVIALKILMFLQQAESDAFRVRQMGIVYGLGVLTGFALLAAFVISLQQATGAAGWGAQMQSIPYRIIMLTIVVLVALNLFGVFEVSLGGKAIDKAAELSRREGVAGAFFSGLIATALATPCTAPFLAIAVGWAMSQPPLTIVAVFQVVGLGLATPFVLLSWFPAWLRLLPKPGPWMESVKVFLGFPMLGAAVWILDFTAPSLGRHGVMWLGLFLVILGCAAWVWGRFVQRSRGGTLAAIVVVMLLVADYFWILEGELKWRCQTTPTSSNAFSQSHINREWQAWSPSMVERARREGNPVLVDFTADWCITCRFIERWVFEAPEVQKKIRETGTILFRADYTNMDPLITQELQKYGRSGVPLVVIWPPGLASQPIIMPTVFTAKELIEALDRCKRTESSATEGEK